MSLMVGVGKGAENGILIRNGTALQAAQALDAIVLDKTGTITVGKPSLTDIVVAAGARRGTRCCDWRPRWRRARSTRLARPSCGQRGDRGLKLPDPQGFQAMPGQAGWRRRWRAERYCWAT